MNTEIRMRTEKLLDIVCKNRDKHKGIVDKAFDKYRELAIKEFKKYITSVKAGNKVVRYLEIVEPKDHTKDYDLIISMLMAHVEVEITISAEEYQNYVLDDWAWSGMFETTNSPYTEVI